MSLGEIAVRSHRLMLGFLTRRPELSGLGDPKTPAEWFETASLVQSSWWPTWEEWISGYSGGLVKAREPGGGLLKPIEDAPGSYVRARVVH